LLQNCIYRRSIAGFRADIFPNDLSLLVHNEHRWPGDTLLWMQNSPGSNRTAGRIRQNRIHQSHFRCSLLRLDHRIRTERDQLGADVPDLLIVFLQLHELRPAIASVMRSVKNDQYVLLTLEILQIDRSSLNRKPRQFRSRRVHLKRED